MTAGTEEALKPGRYVHFVGTTAADRRVLYPIERVVKDPFIALVVGGLTP